MEHFKKLRVQVNAHLEAIAAPHREQQIHQFPWLYGALGQVPSSVMFICENPSLKGVERAHRETVDGLPPDIEAQWWGGSNNHCGKRFRTAIFQTQLKETPPAVKGGWRCYITNVIKEMNVADEHRKSGALHRSMARSWAPLLKWELSEVRPKHVFTVGGSAHELVKWLIDHGELPNIAPVCIPHFAGRRSTEIIVKQMVEIIQRTLRRESN